jgi:hypothetical protein
VAVTLKGEAEFEHDGVTVKLVANVMVLLQAEQETGFGVFDLLARANSNLSVMASVLRFAVAEAGGELMDLKAAAEMVLLNGTAAPAVLNALGGALPPAAPAKDGGANPLKAARKTRSGTGTKP